MTGFVATKLNYVSLCSLSNMLIINDFHCMYFCIDQSSIKIGLGYSMRLRSALLN